MNEDDGGGSSRLCYSVACGENESEIILRMHRWKMIDCAMCCFFMGVEIDEDTWW